MASDLDPLDHTPCSCGLRDLIDPWGRKTRTEALRADGSIEGEMAR